ncbi:Ail/Lom family outer membrane beta-barrel protein [Zophobihabitans entericus]|uniref:Ail/Lom family outer membrane beta-barrel protein n=1 Tax=Zophobihabitans entericus TaxID=1635327 RepID=A0A6G9ID86_9GAMM|nr:Ail/Lom family outer membrane beta-barrel protein [Zophobihabitans entericus]QIQ22198.1 Ail/Lom family outer membrane beta-barrel protein [Zophobihabitans entericus]
MKKISLSLLAVGALAVSFSAAADNHSFTLGYAQSNIDIIDNIKGVNLKYRYEWDSSLSVITSFTYMSGNETIKDLFVQDIITDKIDLKYYSLAAGPAYRFNDYVSVYGILGVAYVKNDVKEHWLNYIGPGHEDMGTENYSKNSANLVYSVGVQFNPMENLVVDVAYEGSKLKTVAEDKLSSNGFNIGVGYRF